MNLGRHSPLYESGDVSNFLMLRENETNIVHKNDRNKKGESDTQKNFSKTAINDTSTNRNPKQESENQGYSSENHLKMKSVQEKIIKNTKNKYDVVTFQPKNFHSSVPFFPGSVSVSPPIHSKTSPGTTHQDSAGQSQSTPRALLISVNNTNSGSSSEDPDTNIEKFDDNMDTEETSTDTILMNQTYLDVSSSRILKTDRASHNMSSETTHGAQFQPESKLSRSVEVLLEDLVGARKEEPARNDQLIAALETKKKTDDTGNTAGPVFYRNKKFFVSSPVDGERWGGLGRKGAVRTSYPAILLEQGEEQALPSKDASLMRSSLQPYKKLEAHFGAWQKSSAGTIGARVAILVLTCLGDVFGIFVIP